MSLRGGQSCPAVLCLVAALAVGAAGSCLPRGVHEQGYDTPSNLCPLPNQYCFEDSQPIEDLTFTTPGNFCGSDNGSDNGSSSATSALPAAPTLPARPLRTPQLVQYTPCGSIDDPYRVSFRGPRMLQDQVVASVERRPHQVKFVFVVTADIEAIEVLCVSVGDVAPAAASFLNTYLDTPAGLAFVYVWGLAQDTAYDCYAKSTPAGLLECSEPIRVLPFPELEPLEDVIHLSIDDSQSASTPTVCVYDPASDFDKAYEVRFRTNYPACCAELDGLELRYETDGNAAATPCDQPLPDGVYDVEVVDLSALDRSTANISYRVGIDSIEGLKASMQVQPISMHRNMAVDVCFCYGKPETFTLWATLTESNRTFYTPQDQYQEDRIHIPDSWGIAWCSEQTKEIVFSITVDVNQTAIPISYQNYIVPEFCPEVPKGSESLITVTTTDERTATVVFPRALFNWTDSTPASYDLYLATQGKGDWSDSYRVTDDRWNPFEDAAGNASFTMDVSHLKIGVTYGVFVRAYARAGVYVDTAPAVFHIVPPAAPTAIPPTIVPNPCDDGRVDKLLIQSLAQAVGLLCLIAGLLLLYKLCKCCVLRARGRRGGAAAAAGAARARDPRDGCGIRSAGVPPPYSRADFRALVAGLPEDAASSQLQLEFEALSALSDQYAATATSSVGHLPLNASKNRYYNVVPFDRNRVRLRGCAKDDDIANYINASFIVGYSGRVEYIAAQGPKEETTRDFWCMVYEQDVRLVVMLTKLVECDKAKCHQYYPELSDRFVWGDLAVQCSVQTELPAYTLRTIVVHKGSEQKMVHHLHFHEWPDFGCPAFATHVLQICMTVRRHAALFPGLMLVHCSAGVGRTGTLIAVDILLQNIKAKKKVDVFGVVLRLREQRQFMVQCQSQYIFVYKCLKAFLEKSVPTIQVSRWHGGPCPPVSAVQESFHAIKNAILTKARALK